jgi:hypothetical protein
VSNIVSIQTKVRDSAAVAAACKRLSLPAPVVGTAKLYSGASDSAAAAIPLSTR